MSHEISEINVNGKNVVEAMYANKPAWHGLGTVFNEGENSAPDSQTAMELAHLNWGVDKRKLVDMDGNFSGSYGNYRDDNQNCLGVVSDRYNILQNSKAFDFMDSLAQDGIVKYESAFSLYGGKQVCLLARLPDVDEFSPGDEGLRYILLRNSHDGSCEVQMVPTSVRVVCANTVKVALRSNRKISVRHSGNMDDRLEQAKEYLSLFSRQFTKYSEQAKDLLNKKYSEITLQHFLDELFPLKGGEKNSGLTIRNNKINEIHKNLDHPSNLVGNMGGTFWQVVNSVSYSIDHGGINRYKGEGLERNQNKFASTMYGKNSDLKNSAIEIALTV